jgi:CheY-like chemotaxis protein
MLEKSPSGYRMILMDVEMPIEDGFTASNTIRHHEDPQINTIKIICCTASSDEEYFQKSINAGMNDYLTKPYTKENLENMFKKWMPASPPLEPLQL